MGVGIAFAMVAGWVPHETFLVFGFRCISSRASRERPGPILVVFARRVAMNIIESFTQFSLDTPFVRTLLSLSLRRPSDYSPRATADLSAPAIEDL